MTEINPAAVEFGSSLPLVELRTIQKFFGGVPVLKDARLQVQPGEILGLVGENGAGKSTLMKILGGKSNATPGRFTGSVSRSP